MKKEFAELTEQFKKEVADRAVAIDPANEYCWKSLTLGWALAKGLTPEKASIFANYIRYETTLG